MDQPRRDDVGDAGALIARALLELAERRADVRAALRTLLRSAGEERASEPVPAPPERPRRALPEKVITPGGGPKAESPPQRSARRVDLPVVVRRARWKAAACRLAIDRRNASPDDEATARLEDKLRRQRTELEDCWAWMLDAPRGLPEDQLLADVAACYDTVALAAEGALRLEEAGALRPKPPSDLLYLLAEAQSALLAGLHKCDLRGDSDQRDLFLWLKEQTTRHRIYVDRHMRLDDPADSTRAGELAERIQAFVEGRRRQVQRGRARSQLLNKVRYHARKARSAGAPAESDLRAVETAAAGWLEADLPPGDPELVSLVRELIPDRLEATEATEATARVLAAAEEPGESDESAGTPRDVLGEARPLLSGRRALLFGRPDQEEAAEALVPALGLETLRLVPLEVEEEGLLETLESEVAAPGCDLVLIAERLPQETYARFKRLCMEHERPFVRLPNGMDPEQVAHQVLRQVAWRLRQEARRA